MCNFVSWIEKGDKTYFLTGKQVFHTKRGREVIQQCGGEYYAGHKPIRLYYGLEEDEGQNKECIDFSNPANFPCVIVRAIKRGDMRGLAILPELLTVPAWEAYEKAIAPAREVYLKSIAPTEKARQKATITGEAYREAIAPAWEVYEEVRVSTFWGLFAISENRMKAWR